MPRLTRAHIVHEDLFVLPYVLLRADAKSLNVHDFFFFVVIETPLLASRSPRRLAHHRDGEEVGVDVNVTARVLRELPQALPRLPRLLFDKRV